MNLQSANDLDSDAAGTAVDTSVATGLTTLNVTKAKDVYVTAAATTDINVSGATGGDAGDTGKEVFTATITNFAANAETLIFDGVTYTAAAGDGDTTAKVITAFKSVYNADANANWTITASDATTMTFTAKVAGTKTDATAGSFTGTSTTEATSTLSAAIVVGTQGSAVGEIEADGGKNVTVTDGTAINDITVGATTDVTGSITITDADQGVANIATDSGTDLTITTSTDATAALTGGTIITGGTTQNTGTTTITQNLTHDGAGGDLNGGAVTVDGGTAVAVTVNSTTTATADNSNDIVNGTVTVGNTDGTTTSVSVTQNSTETNYSADAIGKTSETAIVTFGALAAGEVVVIGETADADGAPDGNVGTELTFVASKDLTAAQVAAAIANLTAADTQAAGGVVENGYFLGSLDDGWTSSAVSDATVTFTATTIGDKTDLEVSTNSDNTAEEAQADAADDATFAIEVTDGSAATTAAVAATTNVVTEGAVNIDDNATATMTDIVVDGFGGTTSDIDGANVLANLTLANSAAAFAVDTDSTTLNLTVDNLTGNGNINLDDDTATITTLNVVTAGTASVTDLIATDVTTLNVSGTTSVDTSHNDADLDSVKNVNVTGAAGLSMNAADGTKIETVDASGTTGNITVSLNTDVAEAASVDAAYNGSSGVDTVSLLTATDIDSTIDLGAGDDTLVLVASTTAATVAVTGGEGTDTLSMTTATTGTLSMDNITGFERLLISDAAGSIAVDLEALGFSYATTTGTTGTLTLNKMASGGTVVLTTAPTTGYVVNVIDADTVDTTLNIITNTGDDAPVNVGTLTVADVTTINITATDTDTDEDGLGDSVDIDLSTLDLDATSATTITIDGNADFNLDNAGNTAVTVINASALTGDLTVSAAGTVAATITGGSGDDTLTAAAGVVDTLNGGAGNDTFTSEVGTLLYGGAGADTFDANLVDTVNSYAKIMDIGSGDIIKMNAHGTADIASFAGLLDANTPDPLGNPNLASYANAATAQNTTDAGAVWFNYGENTFIVLEKTGATGDSFVDGEDNIIMISGTIDLSTGASFNATAGTIEIA